MTTRTKKILAGIIRFTISFSLSSSVTFAVLSALAGCHYYPTDWEITPVIEDTAK